VKRYLFRVQYTFADGFSTYEPVCVRAGDTDEAGARAEVDAATERYRIAAGATKTLTLVATTADV
jgi:hypothetical protein